MLQYSIHHRHRRLNPFEMSALSGICLLNWIPARQRCSEQWVDSPGSSLRNGQFYSNETRIIFPEVQSRQVAADIVWLSYYYYISYNDNYSALASSGELWVTATMTTRDESLNLSGCFFENVYFLPSSKLKTTDAGSAVAIAWPSPWFCVSDWLPHLKMTVFAVVGSFNLKTEEIFFRGLAHDIAVLVGGSWSGGVNRFRYLNR